MKELFILDTTCNVVGIYYPEDKANMTIGEINLLPEYIMPEIGKFARHHFDNVKVVSCNLNKSWLQQKFVSERKSLEIAKTKYGCNFPSAQMAKGFGSDYRFI